MRLSINFTLFVGKIKKMSDNLESIDSFESNAGGGIKKVPNGTAVLVLGILSIVSCLFYGVVGIILGIIALVLHKKDKELYNSNQIAYAASFKNSNAGRICAVIGLILSILYFLLVVGIVVVAILADSNPNIFR
jgi:hypothetical protein